ncbi:MAG: Ni/Fe hydrogenase subunit alpha [Desulfobacterales bacterium]|jgi:NAD-reducing hydrogenase large subunit|nr:Ni/Fe hydrogenase subunit alpha [Desulfobacterales bacterium]
MTAQKITIEPVTRIEGHARITIHLDDSGAVERSFLHVDEFRGLEKFSEGRPHFEMPQITQRICGICPVSHHLASAKSCDAIMGVEPPRAALLLRELLHMGQFVQSHGMHFFYLAGPDLVLGFDADPAVRNVFGLIEADPQLALKAVGLRRFGQQIIERLGGKRVHPNFAVPGGVNAPLSIQDRDAISGEIETQIGTALEGVGLLNGWVEKNRDLALRFASFPSNYMGMVDAAGRLALYDGEIRICDPAGRRLEQFHPRDYLDHVAEHVEPWSFLKFPHYRKQGWPQGSYRVGPLGRLNVIDAIPTPLAQEEFKRFRQIADGRPVEGSLFYHYARLIELIYALERIDQLLAEPEILALDTRACGPAEPRCRGIAAIEAPRGTLVHDYSVDANGLIARANLIVATGHNNWAMNRAVESVAKSFVHGPAVAEGMLNRVEAAVRCYDPCFSCSTHAIGRMPLELTLIGPDGRVLGRLAR